MNRGSVEREVAGRRPGAASMRPRFMNRGSQRTGRRYKRLKHSFNEAPIHESGKSLASQRQADARRSASMRPRFMNRGSHVTTSTYANTYTLQ